MRDSRYQHQPLGTNLIGSIRQVLLALPGAKRLDPFARKGMQIVGSLVGVVDMRTYIQNRPTGAFRYVNHQHRPKRPPRPLDSDRLFAAGGTFKPSEYPLHGPVAPKLHKAIVRQSRQRHNPACEITKYDIQIYPAVFLDKTTGLWLNCLPSTVNGR